jgi:hypothetical protein
VILGFEFKCSSTLSHTAQSFPALAIFQIGSRMSSWCQDSNPPAFASRVAGMTGTCYHCSVYLLR